jgi:hypothetical protein
MTWCPESRTEYVGEVECVLVQSCCESFEVDCGNPHWPADGLRQVGVMRPARLWRIIYEVKKSLFREVWIGINRRSTERCCMPDARR